METKKFYNFTIYVLIFSIIFFLSTILSFQIVLKGEMVTLPNLIGKTLEEARSELAKRKLSVVQKGAQFDIHWERGKIIFQEPSPGSKIKINKVAKVILSAGSDKVIVPRLIGKNFQNSSQILKDAGLRRGEISQVHTSKYAAGKILAQYPRAAQEVARNSPVSLLVSQGGKCFGKAERIRFQSRRCPLYILSWPGGRNYNQTVSSSRLSHPKKISDHSRGKQTMIQKDGVDIFFAGSAIFDQENLRDSIIKMKDLAKKIKQS